MRSNRTADVASTRLCLSDVTAIYSEVATTALLKVAIVSFDESGEVTVVRSHGEQR
jgi:hypothetical protein